MKLTSYDKVNADQDIREGQGISKKATRCFHAGPLQDLSLRFRWYDSAAIPD